MKPEQPRIYSEFASWFHLLTSPASYVEEAQFARETMTAATASAIESVLELGSGGGNNASHLKAYFKMTLTDLSSAMIEQSRKINPECEHIQGDMRSLRLGREFDAVFVHDAVCHLLTPEDLTACMRTAFVHCRPQGVALFMPDSVRERCMFREGNGRVRVEHDTLVMGLFSREEWLQWLRETGFDARVVEDPYGREVFVAVHPNNRI
jgi:ubiquinone/menaquinone biosynthesis C-methylase UbiE